MARWSGDDGGFLELMSRDNAGLTSPTERLAAQQGRMLEQRMAKQLVEQMQMQGNNGGAGAGAGGVSAWGPVKLTGNVLAVTHGDAVSQFGQWFMGDSALIYDTQVQHSILVLQSFVYALVHASLSLTTAFFTRFMCRNAAG